MSIAGLDIGTTGAKAVAFDLDGQVLASAYKEYPTHSPHPGHMELDPGEMRALVKAFSDDRHDEASEISRFLLDLFRHEIEMDVEGDRS